MKNLKDLIRRVLDFYSKIQIPLASAGLCYYLTMTFFPLIICLYTLLGKNDEAVLQILAFVEDLISAQAMKTIRSFLTYVSENHSTAMFYAGLTLLLTSASAGARSMHATIGRMQAGSASVASRSLPSACSFPLPFWSPSGLRSSSCLQAVI